MQARTKEEVVIAVFCGGALHSAATDLRILDADIGAAFDVPKELHDGVRLDPRIIQVPLAEGHSKGSLMERFMDDPRYTVACSMMKINPGDLTTGLGQTPILGDMALKDFDDMLSVMAQILSGVKQLTNAAPMRIKLLVCASNSGGTGRGIALEVTKMLAKMLHDSTNAVINVQQVRMGAQTFESLGSHVFPNNGVGSHEDAAWLLDPDSGMREVRSIRAFEMPLLGADGGARDQFVRLAMQAMFAVSTRTVLERVSVNRAMEYLNAFGRAETVQFGYWRLPNRVNPIASAAMHLLPAVNELLASSESAGKAEVVVNVKFQQRKAAKSDEVVDLAVRKMDLPEDAFERLIRTVQQVTTSVTVTLPEHDPLPLDHALVLGMPKTVADFTATRRLFKSLLDEVENQLRAVREAEDEANLALDETKRTIDEVLSVLFPKTAFEKGKALLWNREKEIVRVEALIEGHATQEADAAEKVAVREALEEVQRRVRLAMAEYDTYVIGVADWLQVAASEEGADHELFTYNPVTDLFENLVRDRQTGDRTKFDAVVMAAISGVTRKGLAQIAGAGEDNYLRIAQQLVGMPPVVTPPWGGLRRREKPRQVIVVPPVSEDVKAQLVNALNTVGSEATLAETDTVIGGLAIVKIEVYTVSEIGHYLTRQYTMDYRRAVESGLIKLAAIPGNPGKERLDEILTLLEQSRKDAQGGAQ